MSQSKCPVIPTRVESLVWTENQSGTGWTKCDLTPEWRGLTPEWGRYIVPRILVHEIIVEGDAPTFFIEFEYGTFEFAGM